MFFEISKFFKFFMSPISWMVILLILYFVLKRKSWKRVCLILSIVFFIVFTNGLLVGFLKYQMIKPYVQTQVDTTKHYRVAIVMGGFASINRATGQLQYEENRADRLWEAVRLWRNGQVDRLLITGDPSISLSEKGLTTAPLFFDYMEQMGIPSNVFILEQKALNTRENAVNTVNILREMNISADECLLVTSATHMKRSLGCFAKIGFQADHLTVNNYDQPREITHRSFYPSWGAAVAWEELLNEWLGEVAYKVVGYM